MEESREQNPVQVHVKGLAAGILQEVIRADMSMKIAQIEAWKWFADHRPKGKLINDDIQDGFARNLFLSLSDLKLDFTVKPLPATFWARIILAFRVLFGKRKLMLDTPNLYDICAASDPEAITVRITVSRFKNGTIKASYGATDPLTAELMK